MYLREKFRIQFWLGVTIGFSQLPRQKNASFSAKSCRKVKNQHFSRLWAHKNSRLCVVVDAIRHWFRWVSLSLKAVKTTWRASQTRTPHQSTQVHHQQQHIIVYSYMPKVMKNADSLLFYNF
jgi:hypothetical protein